MAKLFLMLCLSANCGLVWAQTNAPAKKPLNQYIEIDADTGYFDGITNQVVYIGHVFVTDNLRAKLYCGRFTVNLPPDGGHPTNVVAETNVVIDLIDGNGQTNHITADKAIYAYMVINNVTNETVTFTGGRPSPKVENPKLIMLGEPLVLDVPTKRFSGSHYKTLIKQTSSNNSTNASPFDLFNK